LVDVGRDPRVEKAAESDAAASAQASKVLARQRREVKGADAWSVYCAEGRKHGFRNGPWSDLHFRDHLALAGPGGEPLKRGRGVTRPGPLAELLALPLSELDGTRLETWVRKHSPARPTRTQLAFRLLRAFLNWCADHPKYKSIVLPQATQGRRLRDKLGKPNAKRDALQREQLEAWFAAVNQQGNPVIAAYLQCLLLVGARPGEMIALRWVDVDMRWKSLTIRDKVAGERQVPLTPYVAELLTALPRIARNPWVFSSAAAKTGRLQDPSSNHQRAIAAAGLPHLTLHGLRRSFGSLAEWVECPAGVVAQIQGHKPSATAEKHYRVRPLDLLRVWHERIESWVLENAKIAVPQSGTH
jgi:integrase